MRKPWGVSTRAHFRNPKAQIRGKSLKGLINIGSVARTSESEVRLVFRHNYPAKAINCL